MSESDRQSSEWEYLEPSQPDSSNGGSNVTLKQPRTAISKYVPMVDYDPDNKQLSFTFKR